MLSTNRLLTCLTLLILFLVNEVRGSAYNPSRSSNSRRTNTGTSNSVAAANIGTTSSRTQTVGRIPSSISSGSSSQAAETNGIGLRKKGRKGDRRSRRTSTTSSTTVSSASIPPADSCMDDTSPAEDCFDYFTFAIIWSPGYAYKLSLDSPPPRLRKQIYSNWIIHGLWPSKYGNDEISPICKRSDIYFNIQNINKNGLKAKLDAFWYSLIAQGETSNSKFWEHELNKHGKCAVRSTAIGTAVNYFVKTFELFDKLAISTTLSNAGYRHGNTADLGTIINIIKEKIGNNVIVNFVENRKKKEHYLTEVHVCYNIQLETIDCPKSYTELSLNKNITYLERS